MIFAVVYVAAAVVGIVLAIVLVRWLIRSV